MGVDDDRRMPIRALSVWLLERTLKSLPVCSQWSSEPYGSSTAVPDYPGKSGGADKMGKNRNKVRINQSAISLPRSWRGNALLAGKEAR